MAEPINIESNVLIKEPLNIVIETRENKKNEEGKILGLTAAKLDFWKWVIGTLILGSFGLWIQCNNSESDQNLKKIEADANLVQTVSAKFDTTPKGQLAYLTYIFPFIRTDSFRHAVQYLRDSLIPIVQAQINNMASNKIDTGVIDNKKSLKPHIEAATNEEILLDRNTKISPKPISDLINLQDSLLPNVVKIDSAAIKSIESQQIQLTSRSSENYNLINGPQTQWCKEGYYIEFNNTLRIGINELNNNQSITVNFKDVENGTEKKILIEGKETKVLNVGNTYTVYNENKTYQYQVTLNYIGKAGRNPFTKAAYITVATYKKS